MRRPGIGHLGDAGPGAAYNNRIYGQRLTSQPCRWHIKCNSRDEPIHLMNTSHDFCHKQSFADLPAEQVSNQITRQIVTGDRLMVARVHLGKGALVGRHEHHNEQMTHVVSGRLRFWVGFPDDVRVEDVGPGEVLFIEGHIPHSAQALEETSLLDIFTPPREDWLNGTDDYLRYPTGGFENLEEDLSPSR
jgi:quercetin dioxygenase-like cupin family protein